MGPSFFTESFATLNEVLLLDHLQRTAATKAQKDFYRGQLIENALGLFRNNYESSIELQLYDSVAAGRMLDAAGIERLTMATGARASVWFGEQGIRRDAWLQPIQFYTWPLYRVNYSIARILALRYHALLIADPAAFASRYGALLRSGYDAPPNELLRRHLGFDLTDTDALVGAALGVVGGWID
jgi:oligoendopeptidase F